MDNNTITFEVSPDIRVSMKTDPLNELLKDADINTFCNAIDELIYCNARLLSLVVESSQDEVNLPAYATEDGALYYSRVLSRVLRKTDLKYLK